MAKLSMKQRKALPKSAFAVPSKAPGPGSYPMPDASHARNARSRAAQFGSPEVKAAVRKKAAEKFPSIKMKPLNPRKNAGGMLGY